MPSGSAATIPTTAIGRFPMTSCATASVQRLPTVTKAQSCSKKNCGKEKKSTSSLWPRTPSKWPAISGAVHSTRTIRWACSLSSAVISMTTTKSNTTMSLRTNPPTRTKRRLCLCKGEHNMKKTTFNISFDEDNPVYYKIENSKYNRIVELIESSLS